MTSGKVTGTGPRRGLYYRAMLVSITSTTPDATDLGYLLHKHSDRVRTVDVGFGQAHVFYPVAGPDRCTATLVVEVDPVALTRGRSGRPGPGLAPYVNDRPYAASSMLSVALGRVYGSALAGNCPQRPELVDRPIEVEVELPVVPVRGGDGIVHQLFEPLGYTVRCSTLPLDERFPAWGDSPYLAVTLRGCQPVQRLLEHLYLLLPVLDDRKHYWIGEEEIDKLLRRGGPWLAGHPDSGLITRRYLRSGALVREALARLADEPAVDGDTVGHWWRRPRPNGRPCCSTWATSRAATTSTPRWPGGSPSTPTGRARRWR